MFQDNKTLGKESLKFVKTFKVAVEHTDDTSVGHNEDWFPMGKILEFFGQGVKDFKTMDEALEAVRYLCAENRREHGYEEKPELLDDKFPQFSKFWYVKSLGKDKIHKQSVHKRLEQASDLKNPAQLEQGKMFMEGMGFDEPPDEPSKLTGQVENAKAADLKKVVELLKPPYLHVKADRSYKLRTCCL